MNGLHRNELNNAEGESKLKEKLLTLKEVADFLGLSEEGVKVFVAEGKIPAYRLGEGILRFKKGEIEALRERIEILKRKSSFEDKAIAQGEYKERIKYSFWDRIRDFVYFNNFYIFAGILIAILLFIILKHK